MPSPQGRAIANSEGVSEPPPAQPGSLFRGFAAGLALVTLPGACPACPIRTKFTQTLDRPVHELMTDTLKNSRQASTSAFLAVLLHLALGLFLVEAGVSLLDDTVVLAFGVHVLGFIRGLLFLLLVLTSILIYLLSGVTPMIPKRFFIPIVLFTPVAELTMIPLFIYHYDRVQQITWVVSLCQVLFGLSILFWIQGAFRFRWPVVRQEQLGSKAFSWLNLSGFVLVNVFVLLPVVLEYNRPAVAKRLDELAAQFGGGDAAARVRELNARIGIAARLRDYNVAESVLPALADKAIQDGCHLLNPRPCTREDLLELYRQAY